MTRTRLIAVGALAAAGLVAGLLVLLLRGGDSNPTVAHVNGQAIERDRLDAAVDHFRKQYEEEGKPFPDEKSSNFRVLQNQLVGLLVYRTELDQAARRRGIAVSNIQVLRKLNENSEGEEHPTDPFAYDTVKSQLQYERIFTQVTAGISAPTTAQLSARRNAAMKAFVEKLKREAKVRYEPGYAPGP
jgi:hypothetical protein